MNLTSRAKDTAREGRGRMLKLSELFGQIQVDLRIARAGVSVLLPVAAAAPARHLAPEARREAVRAYPWAVESFSHHPVYFISDSPYKIYRVL